MTLIKDVLIDGICFFAGMVCMMILWVWHELKHSDYDRGYQDAFDDIFGELKENEDEESK